MREFTIDLTDFLLKCINNLRHDSAEKMYRKVISLFAGDVINNYYFPIVLIVGIVGNIFSFLVSISKIFTLKILNETCAFLQKK